MRFVPTSLPDVVRVIPAVFEDARGCFMETWHERRFREAGIDLPFVQDNCSRSVQGALRGLHYQIRQAQGKLIRVVSGEVFDVSIDLRKSSASFGKWVGVVLSAANKHQLWVPPGFAHGFLVLSETAVLEYKCTDFYAQEFERSIRWDDPDIGIDWPLPDGVEPLLSDRDKASPLLKDADTYR